MSMTRVAVTFAGLCLALAGCPKERMGGSGAGGQATPTASTKSVIDPVPRSARPYQDIHQSAKEAWKLVETAYFVIKQKYADAQRLAESDDLAERLRGTDLRTTVSEEIEKNIFGVNNEVEALFQDAIENEPDNPLNIATYAYYLKARKRWIEDGGYTNTESEALEQISKAIELWPDEASFYLLKIHIMTAPHLCHDWLRAGALEEIAIARRIPEIRELFDKAEQYAPDNHYVNYYNALTITKFTPAEEFAEVREEVMREVRTGNRKPLGYFSFPPPLRPFEAVWRPVRLDGTETQAVYVDHWILFGHYDLEAMHRLLTQALPDLQWPQDKQEISELMYMLYQLGRTKPFDRSYFAMQLRALEPYLQRADPGSQEALDLAAALRFLNDQYQSVGLTLYRRGEITDSTKIGVEGIYELEVGATHQQTLLDAIQGPQAAYLKRAGEILNLDFPLPEDPEDW